MEQYSLQDAQTQLKHLIDQARQGKTVHILDENQQAVALIPVPQTRKPRRAGSARGRIRMSDDFDAPLSDFDAYTE
jgi:antitoxin (DNA-binding transcriptional repressor) of toxin-antitoxin stability system